MEPHQNNSEKLIIIDTDCGTDDAIAIMLAVESHKRGNIKIIGITCVFGNTSVENVVTNVQCTLNVCETTGIDIYKGCSESILSQHKKDNIFSGNDGLGNVQNEFAPLESCVHKEHAVNALVRMVQENPNKITIIAIGPLTNLALAQLLDTNFLSNIKELIILGGCINALGNITPSAEFNFANDPEAVHIVLTKAQCPVTLIPWEACAEYVIPWDIYNEIIKLNTPKARFFDKINKRYLTLMREESFEGTRRTGLTNADFLAMAAYLYADVIKEDEYFPAMIELRGELTRGQLVVDKRKKLGKRLMLNAKHIKIITKFHQNKLIDLLINMIKT